MATVERISQKPPKEKKNRIKNNLSFGKKQQKQDWMLVEPK